MSSSGLTNLRTLFLYVAILEFAYFIAAMMPPSYIEPMTGWKLTPDGHWIVKLISVALLTQAHTAWIFRHNPHIEVAKGLAFYQMASATVDICMWYTMKEDGIFDNDLAKTTVIGAIVSHYILGILLIIGIRNHKHDKSSKSH